MRIVLLNTDYPGFLRKLYAHQPSLAHSRYEVQLQARYNTFFGVGDFYSHALRSQGHVAQDIFVNNRLSQRAWMQEQGLEFRDSVSQFRWRRGIFPWWSRVEHDAWFEESLVAQIRSLKPDLLWNQAPDGVSCELIRQLKPWCGKTLVQQAAAYLDPAEDWSVYDLAISSFPPRVDWFAEQGVPSFLNRLAFEPRILERLPKGLDKTIPLSFVGSFSQIHRPRTELLEEISRHFPLQVWGTGIHTLPADSPLHRCYQGEAWGLEMYRILTQSQITLNHHGDIPPFANNLRLFEATGVGTLLITDAKPNLGEMFDVGGELLAYSSVNECLSQIEHFLKEPREAAEIARAGQARTLRDHTYVQRVAQVLERVQSTSSVPAITEKDA